MSEAVVRERLADLATSDDILQPQPGKYKLPEHRLSAYEAALKEGQDIELAARERFGKLLLVSCPELDQQVTWDKFNDKLLAPLIQELGARTYNFILGQTLEIQPHKLMTEFLADYDDACRERLRRVIVDFLDPTVTEVHAYVLRKLTTFFLVRAVSLPDEAVQALNTTMGSPPRFKVLLDTNFLFSCLGLHDDPSNDAANALISLANESSAAINLKFYVIRDTLGEAKQALLRAQDYLTNLHLRGSLAAAATSGVLSGLAAHYAQESSKAGGPTSASSFFAPYVDNLLQVARSKGIEIYQLDTDPYHVRQDVVDDIAQQLDIETKRADRSRAKSYEQVAHDMTLWHVAKDLRPQWVESPLAASVWIATVDYRFLGFDAFKSRGQIPICVHPTTLVQLFQFWVPHDARLDEALVSTLRLPFLFLEFDIDVERAIVRILAALARFEGSPELSVETITHMLMNEALRDRMSTARTEQEETELVRLELVEHDKELRRDLERIRVERDEFRRRVNWPPPG